MNHLILSLGLIFIILFIIKIFKHNKKKIKTTLIERYKKRFKDSTLVKERIANRISDKLMASPELNIKLGLWQGEAMLREKADIHRARLSKFGRSKIDGDMLFLSPEGAVYKYTKEGEKKFL